MTHQTEDHQQHVTDIIGPWSVPPVELTLRSSLRRPFHSRRTSTSAAATDVSPSDGEVTRGAENQHLPALNSFFFSSLLNMCNQWKNGSSSGREKKNPFLQQRWLHRFKQTGRVGVKWPITTIDGCVFSKQARTFVSALHQQFVCQIPGKTSCPPQTNCSLNESNHRHFTAFQSSAPPSDATDANSC